MPPRKRIAAVVTAYTPKSHADVIVSKFLRGFPTDDGIVQSQVDIVTMYIDQPGGFPSLEPTAAADLPMGVAMAAKYGVKLCHSIREALCEGGGEDVTVDGILAIAEHGDYPHNALDQHMYPRRHFFEQISALLARSSRRSEIPIFTDKHLAVTWADAKWIYDTGKELGLVHMAGSSVPVCFHRDPFLEHPIGAPIEDALMLSYGPLEAYGYHALEALQAMVERRRGGEAGIAAVRCLEGEAVWEAAEQGQWPVYLADEALQVVDLINAEHWQYSNNDSVTKMTKSSALPPLREAAGAEAALFLVECADGFECSVLHCQGEGCIVGSWAYAATVAGKTVSCGYNANTPPNQTPFSYLSLSIEQMFLSGVATWPLERTLLTTGALDALMRSRHAGHTRLETPELIIPYTPSAVVPVRPTNPRPRGASVEASPELLADHPTPGEHPTEILTGKMLQSRQQSKL